MLLGTALKLVGVGAIPLAVTLAIFVGAGLPLWALLDGSVRPEPVWNAAGYRKKPLLALLLFGAPVGVGLVAAIFYFGRVRAQLARAAAGQRLSQRLAPVEIHG